MEITKNNAIAARDRIYETGQKIAEATANRSYLESFSKSKLALLMKDSKESSFVGKEMDAKAHPDYIALLHGIKVAQEEEIRLKWELESARITVEIYRTESANNRAIDKAMT